MKSPFTRRIGILAVTLGVVLGAASQAQDDGSGAVGVAPEIGAGSGLGSGDGGWAGENPTEPPAAGSGEAEASSPAELAVRLAQAVADRVVETSLALTPRARDPRIALLRSGDVGPEVAEILAVEVADLNVQAPLQSRLTALRAQSGELASERDAAATARSAMVRTANSWFDALVALGRPSPALAVRTVLARQLASALAGRVAELQREHALVDASIGFIEARMRLLAALAPAGVTAEVQAHATEVAAERQRLEQESAVTDAVAARAREAAERARAEREAARDALQHEIAARWERVSPRFETVVQQRADEEVMIARRAERREEFAADQVAQTTAIEALLSEPDRAERARLADALVDTLIARRAEVRSSAANRRRSMREAHHALVDARDAVADQRRRVELGAPREADLDAELRAQLMEVANEELRVLQDELALASLHYENLERLWHLHEAQIHFYSRSIDRLVPLLSRQRQRTLFAINGSNLREVRQNIAERAVGLRLRLTDLFGGQALVQTDARWMRESARPLIIVLALLIAARVLPRYRDAVVLRVVELRKQPSLRRFTAAVLKVGEVVHESADELVLVAAAFGSFRALAELPLLRMVAIWWFWIASYRFVMSVVETLVLPRSARGSVTIGSGQNEVRVGVDLFDFDEARGRLIVRTMRLIGLYLVAGRIALAGVQFLIGPGFLFYWTGWAFNVALFLLVYAVAWYWRQEIVDAFAARAGHRAERLSAWFSRHSDRFYSALIVVVLGALVLAHWLVRTLGSWLSGKGPGQAVANFFARKKLERAADGVATEGPRKTVLPVAYQRVFRDHPLVDEPYRIPRPVPLGLVRSAYAAWTEAGTHGTVAIVGDSGSGKTTFAHAVANELAADKTVIRLVVSEKLVAVEAVHQWLIEAFELQCDADHDGVVAALREGEARVAVIDQCENLFLRTVGGFAGVDAFLDICTLTNERVFWVLVFDRYPWSYLHRVRDRRGYFREIVEMRPFSDEQLRALIDARNDAVGVHPNFDRLVGTENRTDQYYELVKTAAGYFRLLAEYSRGNLRVAQHYWLQSLIKDDDGTVHVTLFSRPDARALKSMTDELLFALTAFVQHRALSPRELAETLDVAPSAAEVMTNHLEDVGYIEPCGAGRLRLATRTYFSVLARLREENLLHLD